MSHFIVPSPPRNVTWIEIGNNLINISWAPPLTPNGVIIAYIVTVTFHEDGTQIQHNVSRNLSLVITKPSNDDFIIAVSVMNRAGISVPQNATAGMIWSLPTRFPSIPLLMFTFSTIINKLFV